MSRDPTRIRTSHNNDPPMQRPATFKDASSQATSRAIIINWHTSPVIWTILAVETGERFAYFGFRAILVLYFVAALHYTEKESIVLFAYVSFWPICHRCSERGWPMGRGVVMKRFGGLAWRM